MEVKIEQVMKNLKKNNIDSYFFDSREDLMQYIDHFIKDKDIVSVGGSQTLFELNLIEYLRNRDINFLDRYQEHLTDKQLQDVFRHSFFANVYLTSSNAITEDGKLYNVDGRGNRVAAMIYGPDKVLVIVGVNKIVKDLEEAQERVKKIAAPLNAKRLNAGTPCIKTGYCMECNLDQKICKDVVVIEHSKPNRITVLIVNEKLGY